MTLAIAKPGRNFVAGAGTIVLGTFFLLPLMKFFEKKVAQQNYKRRKRQNKERKI